MTYGPPLLMAAVMLNHVGCVQSILPDARADLSERSNYQRSEEDVARYKLGKLAKPMVKFGSFIPNDLIQQLLPICSAIFCRFGPPIRDLVIFNTVAQGSGRAKEHCVRDAGGLGP